MRHLPPAIENKFVRGKFAVKLSEGQFKGIWLDYTKEKTENKDLKGTGGIIGFARPVTAAYATEFQKSTEEKQSEGNLSTRTESTASNTRWNADVKKLRDIFSGLYIDPFRSVKPP